MPECDHSQQNPDEQNWHQPQYALIEVPLRQKSLLAAQQRELCFQNKCLTLLLYVTTEEKFFHEPSRQCSSQKRNCFDLILGNHRAENGTVALERAEQRIRHVPNEYHCEQSDRSNSYIAESRLPAIPSRSNQLPKRHRSTSADANECNAKAHPQEGGDNETEFQNGPGMLCALSADLRRPSPVEYQWKQEEGGKKQ